MPDVSTLERLWSGRDAGARLARAALAPLELAYRGVVAARGALYDAGVLATHHAPIPVVSVGNLSVGGTGKTPVSAWVADQLRRRGGRPAIVMRGYGGDEPMVHAILNPGVPVVVSPDREAGVRRAHALTADVAVLDDGFQHRRVARVADIVLVSAEQFASSRHLLPAGPLREPLGALARATLALVTRKAATLEAAERVLETLARHAPRVELAVAHLAPADLRSLREPGRIPFESLRGRPVLAIAAVGDPRSFLRQLGDAGADVRSAVFPDHHRFTKADAAALVGSLRPGDVALCTLKDAVKLDTCWPREGPSLWYVSQRFQLERGGEVVDDLLDRVLRARSTTSDAAGPPAE